MEYLKLNNDVEMPIEGLGTFLMTPAEAEAAATAARLATSTSTPPTPT